jgi:tetratricopeptide (TPR) repeat protein
LIGSIQGSGFGVQGSGEGTHPQKFQFAVFNFQFSIFNSRLAGIPPLAFRFILASLLFAQAAGGASDDEKFLDALRARRLFSVAEALCKERLDDQQLGPVDRAQFTIELIRTFAAAAMNAPPGDRAPLWKQARDEAAEFGRNERTSPRLVLVRMQDALTALAEAELLRQEAEVSAAQVDVPDAVRKSLRDAATLLEDLDGELTKEIPLRRRHEPKPVELSAEELASLQNHVRFQLARVRRNQALCYDKGSADRVNALTQAIELHTRLLTQVPDDDRLHWRIRLDQIVCSRLLEDYGQAARLLGALPESGIPSAVQLDARAEAVRLDLATGRPQEALKKLAAGRKIGGQVSPELDYAHLETFLALWQAASDNKNESDAAKWQKQAVGMVRLLEESHGPYWGRRAELLLVRSVRQGSGVHDLEVLVRSADDLYLRKQFDDAVAAYEQAAKKALEGMDAAQAFTLYYKAALVEQQQEHHAAAAKKLQNLALAMKVHPQAGEAHLLAAWNLARVAEADPAALAQYAALLDEQLQHWPRDKGSDKARLWAGRLREHKQAWADAVGLYLDVSPDSPVFEEAVAAAARCAETWLAELKASGQPLDKEAESLARSFEKLFVADDGRLPDPWSEVQRLAAITAARIRLSYTAGGHKAAGKLLEAALASAEDAPEAWQAAARSLLVVALAGQSDRRREAEQMLKQAAAGSPRELLAMVDGLSAVAAAARPDAQAEIAQLQLGALALLAPKSQSLDAAGKLTLARVRADALAATGKRAEAQAAYESLSKEHPDDGQIQERFARFLLDGPDKTSWQQALAQWRKVAARSKPQTERWYRAKYSVALANYKLGDKKQAAQLIRYLQESPPGLESTPLKGDFVRLLEQCER